MATGKRNELVSSYFRSGDLFSRLVDGEAPDIANDRQAVRRLQLALLHLGYPLPKTTRHQTSAPAGNYNAETEQAVRAFQQRNDLHVTGALDARTVEAMDAALAGKPGVACCGNGFPPANIDTASLTRAIESAYRAESAARIRHLRKTLNRASVEGSLPFALGGAFAETASRPFTVGLRSNDGGVDDGDGGGGSNSGGGGGGGGGGVGGGPPDLVSLTSQQMSDVQPIFGNSLIYPSIFISATLGGSATGAPWTLAIPVFLNQAIIIMYLGTHTPSFSLLVHELTHAWQSQHHFDPTAYMSNSAASQLLSSIFTGNAAGAYKYTRGKPFGEYAAEQIAQQVEDGVPEIIDMLKTDAPGLPLGHNIASLLVPRWE